MLRDVICSGDGYPEEPVVEDSVYKSISRRQKPDGSWREAGSKKNDEMWTFIATLKSLYLLIDLGSNMDDEIFELGVKYLLAFQSKDGDFRGVYGHDIPAPDYTGMALDVLFRGNFDNDSVVEKSFDWLISVRRKGEGWAIPALRSKSKNDPSSHNVTGMVLRGFASDPKKRYREEAEKAGRLLANCIFKPDKYPDRRGVEYWGKLAYPFWFTDALSTLDVLSRLGFDLSVDEMKRAYNWILKQQSESGYWKSGPTRREEKPDPWLTYAALRTIKSLTD
jgi:prenyltransferase beta subunit